MCGMIIGDGLATLYELQSVYGVRDLFNMAEVICVRDQHRRDLEKS